MIRLALLISFLHLCCSYTHSQCTTTKDQYGQIVTTCDVRKSITGSQIDSYRQVTYLGSPYLTFPSIQKGKIRVDQVGQEINCGIAYDVVANEVTCQFAESVSAQNITPYAFTIDGIEFVRQLSTILGVDYKIYATTLHNGPTKLSRSMVRQLVQSSIPNIYEKGNTFDGYYLTQERYYIQKGDARPEITDLSKSSVLKILYEQSDELAMRLPSNKLTTDELGKFLAYYDSLMAMAQRDKPPLSIDPLFTQFLHEQIKYPGLAWNGNVYGRVYVGFDIDSQGQVSAIRTLSPENVGFGFNHEVKQALLKLAKVKPAYAGKYVLPVAFTYTNSLEKSGPNVPVNTLSTDRFTGRVILAELVVPVVVSRPSTGIREVWGYYK